MGVDEKAAGRGHDYITVVSDLNRSTVEYLADERKESSLDGYFDQFNTEQLAGIEAVGMDMWEPYANSVRPHLRTPTARSSSTVPHHEERGHRGRQRTQAGESDPGRLGRQVTHRVQVPVALLGGEPPERHQSRFNELRSGDLKTSRAWAIKDNFRFFSDYRRRGWAEKHWKSWYFWATDSQNDPIIKIARTLKRHLPGLLAFFDHRITSAGAEGVN